MHNENSRVKIPALVHFTRLGYEYASLKDKAIDGETNIFIDLFWESINKINDAVYSRDEAVRMINEISVKLNSDDLGEAFYKVLLGGLNGCKLIDFDDVRNNSFHVVTELTYKNGDDEFRPDIIPLLNGMPLSFIEVKKPNNRDGILAERSRIYARFKNQKFRRFINLTQLLVFSNNGEYDTESIVPIQGAFYGTSNYKQVFFNCFREEDIRIHNQIKAFDESKEDFILKDNNLVSIKGTPEYNTNLNPTSPTNRIITSLFSKDRYLMLLKYAFTYVHRTNKEGIVEIEKHIMRYPQLFATLAIEKKLDEGVHKGIIWHTQGSGKTALAFYNVRYLKDYYQKQGKIAKFYFVVDRIDLLTQASREFVARGLTVEKVNSKEDFVKNIRTIGTANHSGTDTITVVNIQKFSEESVARQADYNVDIQRVYFLDEAHRSYNPKGSFLANLMTSDRNAVMIALTGTPLIGDNYNSRDVFGNYIHKYYYNLSIADGYTLKLIREGIETTYKAKLQSALDEIETIKGSLNKREVYAHPKFVSAMVEYIAEDFGKSRIRSNDNSIGGMVVCDSSNQARAIFEELQKFPQYTKALILHDEDDKDTRGQYQQDFKDGNLDLLVVYNMLLTGFDAPRLKKQYLCRIIKAHNLLQTLTRVNRPYKEFRYGYVVDFADIRNEFDKTNKAYFEELQAELGDAFEQYSQIFKEQEEIEKEIAEIKNKLFLFDTTNKERFTQQISQIEDKQELLDLKKALDNYKALYNIIKLFGYTDLMDKLDIANINVLYNEVSNRINIINLKESIQNAEDSAGLLNIALDQIDFQFRKVSEKELVIADKFRDSLERTRKELERNLDKKDPEFISLFEELKRIFSKKNIEELTADEMNENIAALERIKNAANQQNLKDQMLCEKYENDAKFMRAHKRLKEHPPTLANDIVINQILLKIKHEVDNKVLRNQKMLANEPYFTTELMPIIIKACNDYNVKVAARQVEYMKLCIANEYFEERKWVS